MKNTIFFIIVALLVLLIGLLLNHVTLWIQALVAGVRVSLWRIVSMSLRKISAKAIIESKIMATKAGLDISIDTLEGHYLAGGNVNSVINALMAADKASLALPFEQCVAFDLAGHDILEMAMSSVNPLSLKLEDTGVNTRDRDHSNIEMEIIYRINIDEYKGKDRLEELGNSVKRAAREIIGEYPSRELDSNMSEIAEKIEQMKLDQQTGFDIVKVLIRPRKD